MINCQRLLCNQDTLDTKSTERSYKDVYTTSLLLATLILVDGTGGTISAVASPFLRSS